MAELKGGQISSSWVASGDLSGSQYRFVNNVGVNANDFKCFQASSGGFTIGVLQNKPKSGEEAGVVNLGHTKVLLAGSLGAQTEIMPGVGGAATATGSGFPIAGFIYTAGNSGEIVPAFIIPQKARVL